MNDTPGPNITLMKWIVIILGVLIVIFTAVIGVKLYNELTAPEQANAPKTATGTAPVTPLLTGVSSFEDFDIPLPEGSRVVDMTAARDRLYVQIENVAQLRQILVIDTVEGRLLGRIRLTPPSADK